MLCFAQIIALFLGQTPADDPRPFAIEVIDAATGRGVPLIELRTVNSITLVTDSNGLAAFFEPGLMDRDVFFFVEGHGYEFPKDGFGMEGKRLRVTPGGSARLEVKRLNIAERLYRITGGGIYRDTTLLGRQAPIVEPLIDALVLGQDSVQSVVLGGKILWFWGDTNWPSYPLGDFHCPGATSDLPGQGGLDPGVGINLAYYTNPETGFARGTAKMPGEGPTWITGLAVLREPGGRERLLASYAKIRPPMDAYQHGIIVWNQEEAGFEQLGLIPEGLPLMPEGHTFQIEEPDGTTNLYFARPYPLTRVKADPAAYADPASYEGFTCLAPGSTTKEPRVERDAAGRPVYAWKRGTPALDPTIQKQLVDQGLLAPDEAILALRDVETGKAVMAHGASVGWNDHRKRWVMITVQAFGEPSFLGEVWFAEADAPEGPWIHARRIVTHEKYSFYNPKHHTFFDQEGGRLIYFEGTYTATFSGNTNSTPRYDYNQVMYRLDLADPRLNLPVPVRLNPANPGEIAFLALPRPSEGSVPLYLSRDDERRPTLSTTAPGANLQAVAHGLPATTLNPPPGTELLYEFTEPNGARTYLTPGQATPPGAVRSEHPLALVWPNPVSVPLAHPRGPTNREPAATTPR